MNRFKIALLVPLATLMMHEPTFAADEYNTSTGITSAGAPLGLHGFDPVALSRFNAVAEGDAAFTETYDGVAYYFASQMAADKFSADPASYLPQFGGFCAYAVALGRKFDGDPQFADIVDGKLYLFVNAAVFAEYKKNPMKWIKDAHAKWPEIEHTAVEDL